MLHEPTRHPVLIAVVGATVALLTALAPVPAGAGPVGPLRAEDPVLRSRVVVDEGDPTTALSDARTAVAPHTLRPGATFPIRARIPWKPGVGARRPVVLQQRIGAAWTPVASGRVGSTRRWTVTRTAPRVPATLRFRVVARAFRGLPRYRSTTVRLRVVARPNATNGPAPSSTGQPSPPVRPSPTPATTPTVPPDGWDAPEVTSAEGAPGSPGAWSWFAAEQPRWCRSRTITWTYAPGASYPGSTEDVKRSFARVSGVSGLRFKYLGPPSAGTTPDLAVGWATGRAFPSPNTLGTAEMRYTVPSGAGTSRMVTGLVTFNLDQVWLPGIEPSAGQTSAGQVMQHEVMHAVGLGHVDDVTQLMNPYLSASAPRMGAGDRTGLGVMGQHAC